MLLALLCAVGGVGAAWADEVTVPTRAATSLARPETSGMTRKKRNRNSGNITALK